ncbi:MAG: DNA polymerase I [Candidatus Omnitrophica bacterium]|nr:DNA polymerase I [Candidatus Omnitrophota bacterium]
MAHKLYLIDGNSFCYRAYYAIGNLANSKGFPTNAVYGFVKQITKIIHDETPDYIAVCFDMKEPTFRHKKYDDYKAQRKPMPDGLVQQMPVIKETVAAFNIAIYEKSGFEADDVIGTLANAASKKGIDVFIVTGDKDALQLVGEHVFVYNTHKDNLIYDKNEVEKRYEVPPEKIVEVMSLMGDASDNIPGVRGIGEKTAIKLIKEYGSLDNVYGNINKIKSDAQKKILLSFKEDAYLSRELATIDTAVDIDIDFSKLKSTAPDGDRLYRIFKEMEFKSLLQEYAPQGALKTDYRMLRTAGEFESLIKSLNKAQEVCLDFETTGVDPMRAELVGVSFCHQEGHAQYISLLGNEKDLPKGDEILKTLKPFFENEKIKKIGQNIKYEILLLKNRQIELKGVYFDTMIASYLLNPSKANHNLSDISLEYLDHKLIEIDELIGKGKNAVTMDLVEPERVSNYCCQDSDVTLRLKNIMEKKLKEKDLYNLFCDIEMPLAEVLAQIEYNGVSIDTLLLQAISSEMNKRLASITSQVYETAGGEFNINSPKQLSVILFEKLKLPVVKKTKTGISTDVEVLTKLADKHKVCALLLEYRELSKLKSTYVDALPEIINPRTKKVHTSFNQTVTATGRLSSSSPNLQNIPIKTEEGKRIRKAFIPSQKERFILSADYSQIELRILAHLSQDAELIEAFKKKADIHRHTASLIFNCAESEVTQTQRAQAKTVNFGIIYGMSPYGLSKELSITPEEAKIFIESYFMQYEMVKEYMDNLLTFARENHYVFTMFGRRRYMPDINSENQNIRQFAERTAINMPIQGSAADLIKIAMININKGMNEARLKSEMILQVHDELVFDVLPGEEKFLTELIRDKMENAVKLKVPVEVSINAGKNWAQC